MIPKLYNWRVRTGKTHRFSDEFFHVVGCIVMSELMVSVMTTTVTQQSMMLDWVNVGTDSNHRTVKVNVKMLTIVLTALAPQANYKHIQYLFVQSYVKCFSKTQVVKLKAIRM